LVPGRGEVYKMGICSLFDNVTRKCKVEDAASYPPPRDLRYVVVHIGK